MCIEFDVRECLKPAIRDSKFKQSAVAAACGFTTQQLSDIINGRRRLDANELIKICRVINITPDQLLAYGEKSKEVG
ncbi:MAG: helix-turn-helix transcriptional regulator [Firmicutes bacterium]|jgi:transcriptional regulator with XRE-family HTH domain|nr:helix-turn-helix transcriptional regulator [Bacillota bacterium]NBI63715.1 XRE family transcriptional regulator [Clostridiales bacterium]